jgi:signal peptidase I
MLDDKNGRGDESIVSAAKQYSGEALRVIVISLAIILPVRYFLVQPFYVKGASMEPNFKDREYLVINELSYRFETPVRGEIVVFRPPTATNEFFIKRVIGEPGEKVTVRNGVVTIADKDHPNGYKLDESAYIPGIYTPGDIEVTLAADQYFLMGDNRSVSMDSRSFGPVSKGAIVGKVWIRGWPLDKIGSIESPSYAGI